MSEFQKTIFIVFCVVFAAGLTPIAIRYTQAEGVPSLVIVFFRLWIVTLGLLPIIWSRHRKDLQKLNRRQISLSALAGFWSALNLLLLFFSLEYTSVLISSVLRRTTPIWIILPEIILLNAVFSQRIWWSIALTLVGVPMIALGGASFIEIGSRPLLGAGMAGFGAICFGIYLLIGRQLRDDIPSFLYSWLVFLTASLVISVFIIFTRTPLIGYSAMGYIWVLIVTFIAQIMGQVGIVFALQRFSATAMAIIVQVGVVMSAIIATLLFGEIPTYWQLFGSVLVIVGVVLATIEQSDTQRTKTN